MTERVARLEEAVAVDPRAVDRRAGDAGDARSTRSGRGRAARAGPAVPRSSSAGSPRPAPDSPPGSGTAGRPRPDLLDRLLPVYEESLAAAGRVRADTTVIVGWEGGRAGKDALAGSPWIAAPVEEWHRWRERGADGVVVLARTNADIDALVHAAERW